MHPKKEKEGFVFLEGSLLRRGPARAHSGPYGPVWARMGPHGSIWAHMGPDANHTLVKPYSSDPPIVGPALPIVSRLGDPCPGPFTRHAT